MSRRAAWVGLVFLVGCSDPALLAVDLETDLVPELEFGMVRVQLLDAVGGQVRESNVAASLAVDYASATRVAEWEDLDPGRYTIRMILMDGAVPVVEQNLVANVRGAAVVRVLVTRDCRGVECPGAGDSPAEQFCLAGRCVQCDDGECTADDCGAAADCAPMASCAEPACERGACLYAPRRERCEGGEVCDPANGCLPFEARDAGRPDGGGMDGGGMDGGGMDGGVRPDAGPPGDGGPPCVPTGEETCNELDDDCDGLADEDFDLRTDPLRCGSCTNVCPDVDGAHPVCAGSICGLECDAGFDDCDATIGCEADLSTARDCGACGVQCMGGTPLCVPDGAGGYECGSSCTFTDCDGVCVDTSMDEANCGGCGVACDAGEVCSGSSCRCGGSGADCGAGQTCCGTTCRSTDDDEANCGGCGVTCDAGEVCTLGLCRCGGSGGDCGGTPASTCCGTACRDTRSEEAHCGGCNMACGLNEECVSSSCACSGTGPDCADTPASTCCEGACRDLRNDPAFCGMCTRECAAGESCSMSSCGCGVGGPCIVPRTCCGSACENLLDDEFNCGACGVECASGEFCLGGQCACGTLEGPVGGGAACGASATCVGGVCCCGSACAPVGARACAGALTCCEATMMCVGPGDCVGA